MKKAGITLAIAAAGLVLVSNQALSYGQRKGPDRIGDDLDRVLHDLSDERSMNRWEIDELRDDLAEIRWQLAELEDNWRPSCNGCGKCDYCSWGGNSHRDNGRYDSDWKDYGSGRRSRHSGYDNFDGWGAHARVDYDLGDYGELHVHVSNDYRGKDYQVDWTIDNAWGANARFEIERQDRGDIYVIVNDDHGHRRFRLDKGGLGSKVYYEGDLCPSDYWDSYRRKPQKQAKPRYRR
ncbi:hypothetical protein KDL44_03865 [bacterium]|nr:hypothetical protein [bacterium]